MLSIEKTLQDIQGLQKELAAIGVGIELGEPIENDEVMTISAPCFFDDDGDMELHYIQPDGNICDGGCRGETVEFREYRTRLIDRLARYYEDEAESIPGKWAELCGRKGVPLPQVIRTRKERMEDAVKRLRGFIKDESPELSKAEYKLLENVRQGRDARLFMDSWDCFGLVRRGLIRQDYWSLADPGYSGLTELGERAMKGYENHVKNGD